MTESVADPLSAPTQDALAVWFASAYRERLRYVGAWKRWMEWDGRRWRADATLLATDLARAVCGQAAGAVRDASDLSDPSAAAARALQRLGSAALPAAIERLARTDRALAAAPDQWDKDPDLLNTPDGIVNTRTGALSPHRPDAWMTRLTAVAPAVPGTPHPLWSRLLDRVTGGDADLAFYLQRVAGYALTGRTSEHAVFFLLGSGANGKSMFAGTLARILGVYAGAVPVDGIIGPAARLAAAIGRLDGARLALVEDGSDGTGWSAARIKALSGGEPAPRCKLLVAANEWPNLGRVDEAVSRRLHLVQFAAAIQEAERDPHLPEKLEAEHAAILRWAIDGALAWHRIGLKPPERIRAARDEHLDDEDTLAQWLADDTERAPTAWAASAALYGSWQSWCRAAGEAPGSRKRFGLLLKGRGFLPKRQRTGRRGFLGLTLRDNSPAALVRELAAELMEETENASSCVIDASQPSPALRGRGCERSERVRAGAVPHANTACLPEAPSPALTLPSPRGDGPLPLPRSAGEGLVSAGEKTTPRMCHHPSSVITRAPVVPQARWKQMIGRHLPASAESALLSNSPILAAVLAGPLSAKVV